jgi:hypothetical protein
VKFPSEISLTDALRASGVPRMGPSGRQEAHRESKRSLKYNVFIFSHVAPT